MPDEEQSQVDQGGDYSPGTSQEPEGGKKRRSNPITDAIGRGLRNRLGRGLLGKALGKGGTNAANEAANIANQLANQTRYAAFRAAAYNPYVIGGIVIFFIVLFLIGLIVTIVSGDEAKTNSQNPQAGATASQSGTLNPPPCTQGPLPSGRLTHEEAASRLSGAGISVNSTGNCSDRNIRTCTSLEGVLETTIDGIIDLQGNVNDRLVVRGGTEVGHAGGYYSHANGFKLDIESNGSNDAISQYVKNSFSPAGQRGGLHGGPRYIDSQTGNEYVFETAFNHWDILFRGEGVLTVDLDGQNIPEEELCSVEA